MAKVLTAKEQEEFFSILGDPSAINLNTMVTLFARFKGKEPRYSPSDEIRIGPEQSPFVNINSPTTIGIYITNKFIYEDLQIVGYINKTLNGKMLGKIDEKIATAVTSGEMPVETVHKFIDRCQFLYGGPLAHIINTSMSPTILNLPKSSRAILEKRLKENAEKIKENDPQVSSAIEREVVTDALEHMRKTKDPALAIFDSGCGVDPYNNYRTMFVEKGAITDNTGESPTGYKIVTSNYNDGITKEDMPIIADTLVTSAYSRGVSTQFAGTSAKKYNAGLQAVRLAARHSDCGTKKYFPMVLLEEEKNKYLYRYIMISGKPILLTAENIDNYVGKIIQLRSPIYCKEPDPAYCNTCAGDRIYRIGLKNIGLTFNIIAGSMLNAGMKKFHDISVKYYKLTTADVLKYASFVSY